MKARVIISRQDKYGKAKYYFNGSAACICLVENKAFIGYKNKTDEYVEFYSYYTAKKIIKLYWKEVSFGQSVELGFPKHPPF